MDLPSAQVRTLLEDAGAERVGSGAVDKLAETLEEVSQDIAQDANSRAQDEDRKTVSAADVRTAAGRIAVHDIESPLPAIVLPADVVERHFHLTHDDLDEVIKRHWKREK